MSRVDICAVPAALWRATPKIAAPLDIVQDLIHELDVIERRLRKRVAIDADRERQETCSESLERAVLSCAREAEQAPDRGQAESFLLHLAGGGYLALLAELRMRRRVELENDPFWPIGRGRVPPDDVAEHADVLEACAKALLGSVPEDIAAQLSFLRERVIPGGYGLVEMPTQDVDGIYPDLTLVAPAIAREAVPNDNQIGSGKFSVEVAFERRVAHALATGAAVNMSEQNHVVITRVLAKFLMAEPEHPPASIRIAYGDGSEAAPFPLRQLPSRALRGPERTIPVALMSMRHLFLDELVVKNWFRNRQVDQTGTLAESDAYCHRVSTEGIARLTAARGNDRIVLHVYHTGYEPAVVGLYRAAMQAMATGADWLRLVPYYYIEDGVFDEGPSWPPLPGIEDDS